tara:strand:- start:1412 stop:2092 length:681 start_codon:yes stop_codon:yes gene_type:complete
MPNYAYLKTDIINTTENDSTEFADQIPKFIKKAELRIMKDLDDVGLDEYTTVSVTSGNAGNISLNDRVRIVRNVSYTVSTRATISNLLQRTTEYVNDYWPVSASTGTPRYYSRKTNSSIKIVPTPVSAITAEIKTASQPLPLASATDTSVTTTNYFSEYCYDALFYGALIEATMYMKDWATLPVWAGEYNNSIQTLQNQARRTRQDDMEVAASPAGGPDTIIQGGS